MAVLKLTNVLYGTPERPSTNIVVLVLKMYVLAVFLYIVVVSFGVRVISISTENAKSMFLENYTQRLEGVQKKNTKSDSKIKNQKILVISASYGLRFFGGKWFIRFRKPSLGDYVLAKENNNVRVDISLLSKIVHTAKYITNILSFGLLKFDLKKQLFIVDAIGSSRIRFSKKYGIEKNADTGLVEVDDFVSHIPLVTTSQFMNLKKNEVFLSGRNEYQLDSRFLGAFDVSRIFGKAVFFVGPVWMPIKNNSKK